MSSLLKIGNQGPTQEIIKFLDADSLSSFAATCSTFKKATIKEIAIRATKVKLEVNRRIELLKTSNASRTQHLLALNEVLKSDQYLSLPDKERDEILIQFWPTIYYRTREGSYPRVLEIDICLYNNRFYREIAQKKNTPKQKKDLLVLAWAIEFHQSHRMPFSNRNEVNGVIYLNPNLSKRIVTTEDQSIIKRSLKLNNITKINIIPAFRKGVFGLIEFPEFCASTLNQFKDTVIENVQEIDARQTTNPFFSKIRMIATLCIYTLGLAALMYFSIYHLAIKTWHVNGVGKWVGVSFGSLCVNLMISCVANRLINKIITYFENKDARKRHYLNPKWQIKTSS